MSLVTRTLAVASLGLAALCASGSQAKAGDYCREYTRSVYVGGIQQQAYGTACLEPDGAWRIADESLNNNRYDDGYVNSGYDDGGYVQNASNVTYIIHDGPRVIHQPRIRYVRHYVAPRPVYYSPGIRITYYDRDNRWERHDRWDRHDRRDHDRWDRHDRGRHNGWRDRD